MIEFSRSASTQEELDTETEISQDTEHLTQKKRIHNRKMEWKKRKQSIQILRNQKVKSIKCTMRILEGE